MTVGAALGGRLGLSDGADDGCRLGVLDGESLGLSVGVCDGAYDGRFVGVIVGMFVGGWVGKPVVGRPLGNKVDGTAVGLLGTDVDGVAVLGLALGSGVGGLVGTPDGKKLGGSVAMGHPSVSFLHNHCPSIRHRCFLAGQSILVGIIGHCSPCSTHRPPPELGHQCIFLPPELGQASAVKCFSSAFAAASCELRQTVWVSSGSRAVFLINDIRKTSRPPP